MLRSGRGGLTPPPPPPLTVSLTVKYPFFFWRLPLSIFSPISIFSKFSYRYFFDIDILKMSVDISSIFQKKPIYRQSISIFHQKSMKNSNFCWKKRISYPKCPYRYRYRYGYFLKWPYRYRYRYRYFQECPYRYRYRYFYECLYRYRYFEEWPYRYRYRYFQKVSIYR